MYDVSGAGDTVIATLGVHARGGRVARRCGARRQRRGGRRRRQARHRRRPSARAGLSEATRARPARVAAARRRGSAARRARAQPRVALLAALAHVADAGRRVRRRLPRELRAAACGVALDAGALAARHCSSAISCCSSACACGSRTSACARLRRAVAAHCRRRGCLPDASVAVRRRGTACGDAVFRGGGGRSGGGGASRELRGRRRASSACRRARPAASRGGGGGFGLDFGDDDCGQAARPRRDRARARRRARRRRRLPGRVGAAPAGRRRVRRRVAPAASRRHARRVAVADDDWCGSVWHATWKPFAVILARASCLRRSRSQHYFPGRAHARRGVPALRCRWPRRRPSTAAPNAAARRPSGRASARTAAPGTRWSRPWPRPPPCASRTWPARARR